jgi:hypothetical protein
MREARVIELFQFASREELIQAMAAGTVLMVRTSDDVLLAPVSQFRKVDEQWTPWPEMQHVLRILRDHDPWAVAQLIRAIVAPELKGLTLRDALLAGQTHMANEFALTVHREWSAGSLPQD